MNERRSQPTASALAPQSPAPVAGAVETMPDFDDPRVQAAYEVLCSPNEPPTGEHWEGFSARRIVAALAALHPQPAPAVAVEAAELIDAARAVVERWDSPQWKDVLHTAVYINRLRNALAARSAPAVAGSQWMPIETVPKDGTPILVWLPVPMLNTNVHAATYHPNLVCIGGVFAFDATSQPTHWCHQPAPPTVGSGSAQEGQAK